MLVTKCVRESVFLRIVRMSNSNAKSTMVVAVATSEVLSLSQEKGGGDNN